MLKLLDANKFSAASISLDLPMTRFEHFAVLEMMCLPRAEPVADFETVRKWKDVREVLIRGWDWDEFSKSGGLKWGDREQVVTYTFTRAELKTLSEIAKLYATKCSGDSAFAMIDLFDRVDWVLTPEAANKNTEPKKAKA